MECKISVNVSNANLMLSHAVPSIGEWTFLFVIQRLVSYLSIIFGNSKKLMSHQNSVSKTGIEFNLIMKTITYNFVL